MMSDPWLSVVMPTYNGSRFLRTTLTSVAQQADDIEVIAVDDGSTDATLEILDSFRARLPLRLVARNHAGNWVANTNHGLQLSRGRWVSFLHQDDLWMAGRISTGRETVRRHPDAALIVHPCWFLDERGRRLGRWNCPLRSGMQSPATMVDRLLVQNFIGMPAPVFRRDVAKHVGGLDESLWYTADWDFWLKLAATGPTIYVPKPLAGFRIHRYSQTTCRAGRSQEIQQQIQIVLDRHLNGSPESVRTAAEFSMELNAQLAASAHGGRSDWRRVALGFAALGSTGWQRFLRDSRITERICARLRARLWQ